MRLAIQQAALARLTTDAVLLAGFRAKPAETGELLGLTPQESASFMTQGGPIDVFGRALRRKRLREAEHFLPTLKAKLGDQFTNLFENYCEVPGSGARSRRQEAAAFAEFVCQQPCMPLKVLDAAIWDGLRHKEGRLLGFRRFFGPDGKVSLHLWWRWRNQGNVYGVSWPLKRWTTANTAIAAFESHTGKAARL